MILRLIQFLKFRAAIGQEPWKIKQRVKLRPSFFDPSSANPCVLSLFECAGTVTEIERHVGVVSIRWDNGNTTKYFVGGGGGGHPATIYICDFPTKSFVIRAVRLDENNPNVAFKKQKELQTL